MSAVSFLPARRRSTRSARSPRPPGQRRHWVAGVYVALVLAFLFSPLVVMVLFSFHSVPRMSLPFAGFSLRWYREIFDDTLIIRAMGRTARAALMTGLATGILGLAGALGLAGLRQRVRSALLVVALIPLTFPMLLYAIGLAIFYREAGIGFSLWATIGGHIVMALPFVFLIIGASLDRFRFTLLEAAYDLGASRLRAFWTVTLPLILPAVLGAMLLAMALSVDEFVIAFFTAGQDKTLPLLMYGRINQGLDPTLNAVGTVLLVATTSLAFFAARRTTQETA